MNTTELGFAADSAENFFNREDKAKAFAVRRDDLVMKYMELRGEVSAKLKKIVKAKKGESTDCRDIIDSMDKIFIETMQFLLAIFRSGLDGTAPGHCFQSKTELILFIVKGIVRTGSVRPTDFPGILDLLTIQIGRLTLDPNGDWDIAADRMDQRADGAFAHFRRLADKAGWIKQKEDDQTLPRDMRWFLNCWQHVNWYDPQCDCLQCSTRGKAYPFREVCWEQEGYDIVNRQEIYPDIRDLGPLEPWTEDMNDCLGETY